MSCKKNSCQHINQIIDEHEGTYICTDCAQVVSNFFCEEKFQRLDNILPPQQNEATEILSRLNLPDGFIDFIEEKNDKDKTNITTNATKIYLTTNINNSVVTLKEISAITGINSKKIAKKETNIIDKYLLLEKYCALLDLNYKTYTVIKEKLKTYQLSGHNPLTVVASAIYIHSKENKLKLSMKKISDCFGISSISIQRYLKK